MSTNRLIRTSRIILYKKTYFNFSEIVWTFLSAFLGILTISTLNHVYFAESDLVLLIGSFGASAVLIYGVPNSPLSKEKNVIGGHMLSAFVGVTIQIFFGDQPWLAPALAVSSAIIVMQITRTIHPPGGATALIAVIGSEKIKSLGYLYVFFPVLMGLILMLLIHFCLGKFFKDYQNRSV